LRCVEHVEVFKRLPAAEQLALANAMVSQSFTSGARIIEQGTYGDKFYVIKVGDCSVEIDGNSVAYLKAGDYFGEKALLRNEPRAATIRAMTRVETLVITREKFEAMGLNEKLEFPKRGAVGGGADAKAVLKPPSPKTSEEAALIKGALTSNTNLSALVSLDDSKVKQIAAVMWKEAVANGTRIIKQGDLRADYFYIVASGSFEVLVRDEGRSAQDASVANVGEIKKGGSFGEFALMYLAPRAATVSATSDSEVFVIHRKQFKEILMAGSRDAPKTYVGYLDRVEVFSVLKDHEKEELAHSLHEMYFSNQEIIFQQGEEGDLFYILVEGAVDVIAGNKDVARLEATAEEKPFFGERALTTGDPRKATVKVVSPSAVTLTVDKQSFEMLLGPLCELRLRGKDGTATVAKKGHVSSAARSFGNVMRRDLKKCGLLGCGGFGAVELVEHKLTGDTYAMKIISKGYIVQSGMQANIMNEKNVQMMCDSPFIVKLYETYSGQQSLFYLLELAQGGELFATYNKKGLWGNIGCAKFYVAGATFALAHLHSKKVIFRDLKPENLILTSEGYVKLTDMGLAKVTIGKAFTTCGTPDYFAPEVVASLGYNQAVDWWTLGILTFEMLAGFPPFESATPVQIYRKVTKGINKVSMPRKMLGAPEAFIKSLLQQQPGDRAPMRRGGIENIKAHSWYAGFDWVRMEAGRMEPPYVPIVKSKADLANFSARKEDLPPQIPYKDDGSMWDKDFPTSS